MSNPLAETGCEIYLPIQLKADGERYSPQVVNVLMNQGFHFYLGASDLLRFGIRGLETKKILIDTALMCSLEEAELAATALFDSACRACTVNALMGEEAMRMVKKTIAKKIKSCNWEMPMIFAHTVLPQYDYDAMVSLGFDAKVPDYVFWNQNEAMVRQSRVDDIAQMLALRAKEAGMDGLICPLTSVEAIHRAHADLPIMTTVGSLGEVHSAVQDGATHLLVDKSMTEHATLSTVAAAIRSEVAMAQA